ncbi:MBL fold metallo-hydrolase [Alteribacter lacisalsi]|nr:MBL fold metallo-hydrolase [Alteribacter lacisalsi]
MTQSIRAFDKCRHIVDGFDLGMAERTGSYVLDEEELTLIETGPAISIPHIIEGLNKLGKSPEDVKHIIVTHIHLDHAGGTGLLLEKCHKAMVYVHEKGARHLIDPSRLIKGAKMVYGDKFDALFHPVLPVSKNNVTIVREGDTLSLGACNLRFYDTPGHASHHIGIYDEKTDTFFSGDTIGVRYPSLERKGLSLILPSTSPNQFDPDKMRQSAEKIKSLTPARIAMGHYGTTDNPDHVFKQLDYWLEVFLDTGKMHFENGESDKVLKKSLLKEIKNYAEKYTELTPEDIQLIGLDLSISSMGIMDYLKRKHR